MKHKNYLVPAIIGVIVFLIALVLYVPAVQQLFATTTIPLFALGLSIAVSIISTLWLEVWKYVKRRQHAGIVLLKNA
jgi:Ca2+-transporting ATPase